MSAQHDYTLSPTAEQIAAENTRIEKIKLPGETHDLPKATPEQKIKTLRERLAKFKTYPAPGGVIDFPDPPKDCPVCGGLGVIKGEFPSTHPLFGKFVKCTEPGCPGVQRNAQKREMSMVERERRHFGETPEFFPEARMSDFEGDNRYAVAAARIFLEHGQVMFDAEVKHSLVFYGQVGRGKSYLASAMRNSLYERGEFSQYRKIRTLLKAVQRGYGEESEFTDYEAENLLSSAPYLFIDEFQTGHSSGDRTDILESIIDHRYRENLPVIVVTNIDQKKTCDVWGARIYSRLVHMAWWIEMAGDTRRDTHKEIRSS